MDRELTLRTSTGLVITSPNVLNIEAILGPIINSMTEGSHVIIEVADELDTESHYIQALYRSDGRYQIEFRDGAPKDHYQAFSTSQERVAAALVGWLKGDTEWRNDFQWNSIGDWFS